MGIGRSGLFDVTHLFERLIRDIRGYAIFLMDPDGVVMTWGRGAEDIFGYDEEEIVGQPFTRFFVQEDIAADQPAQELHRARVTGQASDDRWAVRKDGNRFWASGVTVALRSDDLLQGYGKIVRDQTNAKTATHEISRLNEQLLEKVDELERFEDAVVGRELKMIDLGKEIERLRREIRQLRGQA